jgi:hypothetical protein
LSKYLAILFSALLVVVQTLPGRASATPERQANTPCKCCNCGGTGCCVTEATPAPQPMAAFPGWRSFQLNEFLFLQLSASPTGTPSGEPADSLPPWESGCRPTAIPLFQWYCSYLI